MTGRAPFPTTRSLLIVAAICGGVVALGSLLPWASVSIGFASASVDGMSGDGKITVVCGLVLLFASLALMRERRWLYLVLAALGALIAAFTSIYDATNISNATGASSLAIVSVGVGLWLVVVGSIIGCLAIAKALFRRPASEKSDAAAVDTVS